MINKAEAVANVKVARGYEGWIRKPFPHLWAVMYRSCGNEDFEIHSTLYMRDLARHRAESLRGTYGKRNVYVQKYGPIS